MASWTALTYEASPSCKNTSSMKQTGRVQEAPHDRCSACAPHPPEPSTCGIACMPRTDAARGRSRDRSRLVRLGLAEHLVRAGHAALGLHLQRALGRQRVLELHARAAAPRSATCPESGHLSELLTTTAGQETPRGCALTNRHMADIFRYRKAYETHTVNHYRLPR